MLIQCPECNYDNQLGAIFCRNCGQKLDIEKFRPKVQKTSRSIGFFSTFRRLFSTLVLVVLIVMIAAMFIPVRSVPSDLTEEEKEEAKAKFDSLVVRVDGGYGDDSYTFSPREATFLYNDAFVAKTMEQEAGYILDSLIFNIDEVKLVQLILNTKLAGTIPASFEIKGTIINKDAEDKNSSLGFEVRKSKMGHMPLFLEILNKKIAEKFLITKSGENIEKILKAISKIEISEENEFVLTLSANKNPLK